MGQLTNKNSPLQPPSLQGYILPYYIPFDFDLKKIVKIFVLNPVYTTALVYLKQGSRTTAGVTNVGADKRVSKISFKYIFTV